MCLPRFLPHLPENADFFGEISTGENDIDLCGQRHLRAAMADLEPSSTKINRQEKPILFLIFQYLLQFLNMI